MIENWDQVCECCICTETREREIRDSKVKDFTWFAVRKQKDSETLQ